MFKSVKVNGVNAVIASDVYACYTEEKKFLGVFSHKEDCPAATFFRELQSFRVNRTSSELHQRMLKEMKEGNIDRVYLEKAECNTYSGYTIAVKCDNMTIGYIPNEIVDEAEKYIGFNGKVTIVGGENKYLYGARIRFVKRG